MRCVLRQGLWTRRPTRRHGLSAALMLIALTGCTVIQGDTASLDNMKTANAVPTPKPAPNVDEALATGTFTDENIASAGIPIPLISPRHRDVKVASIDPRIGLGGITRGVPISDLAGVYLKYDSAIDEAEASKLKSPRDVRRILKMLRIEEPKSLADGWYAARAMTAANDDAFAAGIRHEVRINGAAKVIANLKKPAYVLRLPGATSAMNAVMASVATEDARMAKLRKRFIDTAFRFQKQKWGMTTPPASQPEIKAADATPSQIMQFFASLSLVSEAQAYSVSVMSKILGRAAREVMEAPILPISGQKDETTSCLNWARLNLNQCIAAAHFPSEEAWCVGTHGIEEVRTCWAAALPAPGATVH
jgi:hypothetical protein